LRCSQGKASLAGTVGDGSDATVVLVATAVEHDGVDAGALARVGDQLADLLGLGALVTVGAAQVASMVEATDQRLAHGVVDDLGDDVAVAAGDDETGTLGCAADVLADALVTTNAGSRLALAALERSFP
jgi:hypothetical protein